jgi:hypothetical protein
MIVSRINNTQSVSKIGHIVRVDPRQPDKFIYVESNATNALGVVTEAKPYKSLCNIATIGETKVFVVDNVRKGDIIRTQKSTDNISTGACRVAKDADVPYLKVGTALSSGRGLVSVSLEWAHINTTSTGSFQPLDADLTRLADYRRIGGDTNYTQFDADGTVQFVGDATVWDDIRIVPNVFDVPGLTDPDIISYQPTGSGATFKVYAFAKGDEGFFTIQLPHSYKHGSNLKAHVHWTPGTRGIAENGNVVQWRLDYSFAPISGSFPASQTLDLSDACDGTNHKHQMTSEVVISGVGLTISSQMWGRIYRWNNVSDTWAGTGANLPIFIEIDIHYEMDTCGSRDSALK